MTLIEAQINGLPCYASNTVPTETEISESTVYIPLSLSAKEWATQITEHTIIDLLQRSKNSNKTLNNHPEYNIISESQILDNYYIHLSGEEHV